MTEKVTINESPIPMEFYSLSEYSTSFPAAVGVPQTFLAVTNNQPNCGVCVNLLVLLNQPTGGFR